MCHRSCGPCRSGTDRSDFAAEQRQLVLERTLGKELRVLALERRAIGDRLALRSSEIRRGALVRDVLDRGGEFSIAAGMVEVGVRIDDHRHRLVGDGLYLGEDSRPSAWEHRIDEHDALVADKHHRVAARPCLALVQLAAGDEIQVIAHLLNRADVQRLLPCRASMPADSPPTVTRIANNIARFMALPREPMVSEKVGLVVDRLGSVPRSDVQ